MPFILFKRLKLEHSVNLPHTAQPDSSKFPELESAQKSLIIWLASSDDKGGGGKTASFETFSVIGELCLWLDELLGGPLGTWSTNVVVSHVLIMWDVALDLFLLVGDFLYWKML